LIGGEFFYHGYRHSFPDSELAQRAADLDKYIWSESSVIATENPMYDRNVPTDDIYNEVYSKENFDKDQKLYLRRKRDWHGDKIAIGMPISNRKNYNEFWLSFLTMDKPDFTLLIPRFEVYEYPEDIAAVRNDIVDQALDQGCSKLIFLDTDQIYPEDTILKLIGSGKDIIGGAIHRRYPPFELVMFRGEIGGLERIPEEEIYSGKVIDVNATGCACVCVDMEVFLNIDKPYFEITTGENGRTIGEDIGFCDKARKAGYKIHVDTSIEIDHLSTLRINRSTYNLFKSNGREPIYNKEIDK
jgi:hypothetical protein